ncbi:hypothetical protein [Nocardia brasiliensis]|uniref:hypothetical protein n=1 Tax=Nocardia brasiliensis TaxID=37326 RepID=UPI001893567E|nr:hypothetical protein [Nocardia brasiliensis]MBF6128942.1 hypothetical protein [Nocardia brasiliensis]
MNGTAAGQVVVCHEAGLESVPVCCVDLAVYDWLLTTVCRALEQADRFPAAAPQRGEIPAAVPQHLASLWMPGAHTPAELRGLWKVCTPIRDSLGSGPR